jgi:hypothetical protein
LWGNSVAKLREGLIQPGSRADSGRAGQSLLF